MKAEEWSRKYGCSLGGEVITKDNIPVHILEAVPENIAR